MLVGLSGGKDSLVTLDVVCRSGAFDRVECFAMYLVPGLECFELPVRVTAERYGVPVHFVPHWDVARLLSQSVLRPHTERASKLGEQSLSTTERALEVRTGILWTAYGYRSQDSVVRAIDARGCDGVHERFRRLWPVWDWSNSAVVQFLRVNRIPRPAPLTSKQSTGVSLSEDTLLAIKTRYPADFRKIVDAFPFAEIQVRRAEAKRDGDARAAVAVPGVPDGAAQPKTRQRRAVQSTEDREERATEAPGDP